MSATLRDIATACNCDISTVSRALRDDPRVRDGTRRRVQRMAARLGYRPNVAARRLVTGRTHTLWLIQGGVSGHVEYEPAMAASRYLHRREYDLCVVMHHDHAQTEARVLDRLWQKVADGALVAASLVAGERAHVTALVDAGFPLVFIDRYQPGVPAAAFSTDNVAAARGLVEHCKQVGAGAIVNLFEPINAVARARREGAERGAASLGVRSVDATEVAGLRRSTTLAIVGTGCGEVTGFAQRNAAALAGRTLIYACFDDWVGEPYPADHAFVCEQNFVAMAEGASEFLLRLIRGEETNREQLFTVPPNLIRHVTRQL
jgi:DNA-binding LacI/PurR family transcriptional regulator